jgi:hypothetical protein
MRLFLLNTCGSTYFSVLAQNWTNSGPTDNFPQIADAILVLNCTHVAEGTMKDPIVFCVRKTWISSGSAKRFKRCSR